MEQRGFALIEILIIVVIFVLIGAGAWWILSKNNVLSPDSKGYVEWSFGGENWQASGNPPACEEPLTLNSPVDPNKVDSVLLPGQVRGGDFKPHGGLAVGNATDNQLDVHTVRDGYLYRASRYIQDGEVQYLFDFIDSCGVMFRFDHLATLTPQFVTYANQLPEPQVDDSRTFNVNERLLLKKTP
ncbi:MAG TPA: hypothetical protein VLA77_04035 [Candidatus Saccharimonadales bacterium]|nr:hypothetical protein [Candidatus Saccharimonadales bacterium]